MVLPGVHVCSGTTPSAMVMASGESCPSGTATTSVWVSRWPGAMRPTRRARVWNTSKSVRASHGGFTASSKQCMKGCMSVEDRSCFSYHVAAGSTTSECSVVEVLRKSATHMRSSLPGWASRQLTDAGRLPSSSSCALTSLPVPSM